MKCILTSDGATVLVRVGRKDYTLPNVAERDLGVRARISRHIMVGLTLIRTKLVTLRMTFGRLIGRDLVPSTVVQRIDSPYSGRYSDLATHAA